MTEPTAKQLKGALGFAIAAVKERDARIAELRAALKLYDDALEEAEAIFCGEYADAYGPMFKLAMDARAARAAIREGGKDD
jgi:hypothetical protein